jgi:hypothetical protein
MFCNFSGEEETVSRGALCKHFKRKLYFGAVAALLLTAEVREGYKIVYEDGNCEDMTLAQLVTVQTRYKKLGKDMSRACNRVPKARAFGAEWQSQLPAKIHAERQTARDSLEDVTFLVRAPKDVADKGRWSDHCA